MSGAALFADARDGAPSGPAAGLLRRLEPIWHIRGRLPLAPGQAAGEALDRIAPLLSEVNTTHRRRGDAIDYTKVDPAAQDRMAVFERGTLCVEQDAAGPVLVYHLVSRALLFCFLAPLLFLAMAQLTVMVNYLDPPAAEKKDEKKKDKAERTLHPIDKFLGAPAPETKAEREKRKKKEGEDDKKPSPTPGYVFAGIFAVLYAVGRWLEPWLVRRLFRRALDGGMPG